MASSNSTLAAKPGHVTTAAFALAAFTLIAAAIFGVFTWQRVSHEETERLSDLTRLAARSTQLFYAQFESAMSEVTTELQDEGAQDPQASRMLRRLEQTTPGLVNATLTSASGEMIATTRSDQRSPALLAGAQGYLPFSTRDRNTLMEIARPLKANETGEWIVPVRFRKMDRDGGSPYLLSAEVSLSEQWRGLSELRFPQHFAISIVREDGYLQGGWPHAGENDTGFLKPSKGPVTGANSSTAGASRSVTGIDSGRGEKRLYTYQAIPGAPLNLYVSMPYRTLWARWSERVQAPYLLALSMSIMGVWIQRRIVKQHRAWSNEVTSRQNRLALLHSLRSGFALGTEIESIVQRTLERVAKRYPDVRITYGTLSAKGKLEISNSVDAAGSTKLRSTLDYMSMPDYYGQLVSGLVGVVNDCATDPRVRAASEANAIGRAMLDAPLAHSEHQIGMISMRSATPRQWTEDEIATMCEVAAQLSLLLREAHAENARREVLKRLSDRERTISSIVLLSSDWFWEQDEQLRFRLPHNYATPNAQLDLAEERYVGKTRWEIPHTHWDPKVLEEHKAALMRREPFRDLEYARELPDGTLRHIRVSGLPRFDDEGRFLGYQGVAKDISAHKQAELALRESEQTLSAMFHATHDGMFIVDLDHAEIIDCNRRALEVFDAPDPMTIRKADGAWMQRLPLDAESVRAIKAHLDGNEYWHQELELISRNGRIFWGDVSVVKLSLPDQSLYLLRVADITERRRAEEALRSSESIFGAVFNSSRDALFLGNIANGSIMECNPRAVDLFEATDKEAILSRPGHSLLRHPLSRTKVGEILGKLEFGEILREDFLFRSLRGRRFWGEMVAVKLDSPLSHVYLVRVADISERKEAESRLRASEQRFRHLTEMSSDWFWEQDSELRFTLMSETVSQKGQRPADKPIGLRRWEISNINDLSDPKWDAHRKLLAEREPFRDFVYSYQSDSGIRWASISGTPVFDEQNHFVGYRGIGTDITDRKQSEDRIRYLAQHDDLTGLLNRTSFQHSLTRAVEQARRHDRRLAVLFVDLDRFKNINDTLGHDAGDAVLKEIAERLRGCLRESDVIARQGGDEFVVLLEEFDADTDLSGVARKVLYAFSQPFALNGKEFMLTASVGIGTFPNDAQDVSSLLKAADIAMYRAKETGRNNFQFYSPQMNEHSLERLALEASLKRALERGELLLHYQPKLDLATGHISGMEALLRWDHPDNGMIPPLQFIPIAEETGLIAPIGAWVLLEACRQLNLWHEAGWNSLTLAVNLSARQFMQDSLVEEVLAALRYSNMLPDFLELEITESAVMQKPERAAKVLQELHGLGLSIAIDDFGTGHSSLAYLRRFPVNTLKIDRSFIRDVPFDAEDVEITRAIIALGRSLHLRVVGEGVETAAQREFLATAGCDEAQGFLIGKPMAPADFERFMRDYHAKPLLVAAN